MKRIQLLMMAFFTLCVLASCSSDDDSNNSEKKESIRKERILTIKQSGSAAHLIQTRTILKDQGEDGIYASWEMGDETSIYNKTYPSAGYMMVKASSSSKNTNFSGMVNCEQGDILRMFYPKVNNTGSVSDAGNSGILTLDISKQKGTLEDIQLNYDFCYGEATVTSVTDETATADMGTSENLMAICKFTFKSGNDYIKGINNVKISGVAPSATYTLSASNTPLLTPDQTENFINIFANNIDNTVYVVLFPGSTHPTFTVTANGGLYEGELRESNLQAGKFYNVVVSMTRTGDAPNADYVEVCGIKWAKGNLQYDPINGGDEGFMENWRIAPTQWHYVGYDKTTDFNPYDEEIKDNFSLGQLGENAYSDTKYHLPGSENVDISGKLFYSSVNNYGETNLFDKANLGDLAFWASKGKYRTPRYSDMKILNDNASCQYGYIIVNNMNINGVLFYNPDNERIINRTSRLLTDEELEKGLFIPNAGRLYSLTTFHQNYTTTKTILQYNNAQGFYMSSSIFYNSAAQNKYFYCLHTSSTNTITLSQEKPYPANNQYFQYKIRPILCD